MDVLGFLAQRLGFVKDVGAGMKLVAAALGDLVEHTAQRTTELGTVAAGLDLLFGNRLERHLGEVQSAEGVGDVEAVDVVLVLGHRRTAERGQVAERRIASHRARCQQRHAGGIARHRDPRDLFGGQDSGGLHRGHVDRIDRAGPDHGDRIQRGRASAAAGDEIGGGRRAHADADRAARAAGGGHRVLAGRQSREAVAAVAAHGHAATEAGGRIGDGDGFTGGGASGDGAGRIRLRMHAADKAHAQRGAQGGAFQSPVKAVHVSVDAHGSHSLVLLQIKDHDHAPGA